MKKRQVGIITVHSNVNYGANLQAFASCKYLNNQGYDSKVIDYTLPNHEKSVHLFSWLRQSWKGEKDKSLKRKIKLAIALTLSAPWKYRRLKAFSKFRKNNIKLTKNCKDIKDIEKLNLDTIVCGSDQIWNPDIMDGINPIFFGDINGVKTKISYAASVGKEKLEPNDEKKVKNLVLSLDSCSVREEDSAEYISSFTGKKIETVCDPVFLLDKYEYDNICSKRLFKNDYVFLYSVVHNDVLTEIAKKYADRRGLKLIEICSSKDKKAKHKQILSFGPSEFLSCIKYAKTVFTNSFHGTAFSIIYEKDFYVVNNKARGSRITNLLNKVGLSERLISREVENDFEIIDYVKTNLVLKDFIDSSKEFLDNAMRAEKKPLAKNCVGCGACIHVCKFDAIRLIKDKEGFTYSVIDEEKCVNCGLCKKICPALNKPIKNQAEPTIYAYKADNEKRKLSASGGAFIGFATSIIEDGGVVYGAVQEEDFSVSHTRGKTLQDLAKMQGTKYVQSQTAHCYLQIENDLRQGRKVLFSGTPCQIDGVNRFILNKNLPTENFYSVDIICHGVPSPALYKNYINWLEKEYGSKIIEYKFRSKKISWRGSSCYALLENGKELENDKTLCAFMNVYYSSNITRECCYTCQYTSKNRVSDLTIGDYWGLENLDKRFEDELGVSIVLVNTDKGAKLFKELKGDKILGSFDTAKQPQLERPTVCPKSREEFWEIYERKGIKTLFKKFGGVKRDSLKTTLYKLKKKVFR